MPLPCLRTNCTQLPEWTIQYSRHDQSNRAIRTRAVSVEWRYVGNQSITYHTNYITYPPVLYTVRTKRTVREPEQFEKLPFGYKSRRISHSGFWLLWKMACTLNKETEMTVASIGIVLCAEAAFEIEEEEKEARDEEARRQVQVKRRKKVKDWVKRRVQLGHNMTLLYELEEEILPASRIT